jgi:hypothetical protein
VIYQAKTHGEMKGPQNCDLMEFGDGNLRAN